MVQGLAFLSKKSWHTKNFANQEKVWIAEEKKRAEEEKTKELAKQIQQEREEEELAEITGQKKKLDRGIDWMYQGSNAQSEVAKEDARKEQEEYLLGKEFVPAQASKGDLDAEDESQGLHAVMAKAADAPVAEDKQEVEEERKPAAYTEPSVHDRNEAFRMRHEDPMFAIAKKTYEKQQKYEEKKALYERVTGRVAVDVDHNEKHDRKKHRRRDDDDRRARKRAKKEKKRRKKDRHSRHHDDESDSDRHHRRRRRSPSYDSRSDDYHSSSHRRRTSRRDRSPSRSWDRGDRSPSYDRHRHRRSRSPGEEPRDERRHNRNSERHRRSRSPVDKGYDRPLSRSPSTDHSRDRRHHGNRRNADSDRELQRSSGKLEARNSSRNDDRRKPPPAETNELPPKREGYGLQGQAASRPSNRNDLGPSKELLERKRRAKEEEKRRLQEAHTRRYRTPEERAEALRAMERDAHVREETRQRHSSHQEDKDDDKGPSRGDAGFLRDMRKATHGIDGGHSMAERLQQNRHTNQRSSNSDFL